MRGFFQIEVSLKSECETMKERLDYIDKAKGILILLTVIGHIWQKGFVHNLIYAFHMPAFFVISGILLSYTQSYRKDYLLFVQERIFAFGIPFAFIEFLGCCTDILRHGVTQNVKGYLYNTLTLHFNDPNLWFLMDLFLVEIFFVLAIKALKDERAVCAVCVLLFIVSGVLPEGNNYIDTMISTFRYYLYFTVGFYGHRKLKKWNLPVFLGAVAIVVLAASVFGKRADGYLSLKNIVFLASGISGTYMVLQIDRRKLPGICSSLLSAAGRNTIIIYGTHHIIYAAAGAMMGITDFASTPIPEGMVLLAVVAVLEVPIIYGINRWFPALAGKRRRKAVTS